ncbi:MAG: methylated-DNA--[Clostridia bacterium]|nr:methylated-DNA--[protein]-cysteine S-methyltransferase [Clostridia bacterium]
MDYTYHTESPLGGITLASDGQALTGLWFDGQAHFGEGLSPDAEARPLSVLDEARRWLDGYFGGIAPDFTPRLAPRGTAFRQAVWKALREIPFGQIATYAGIAARLGLSSASARAVGGAVGHNPISLIIPCHRVLGANGSLTGYAGGLERKRQLLRLERADLPGREISGVEGE